MTSFKTTAVIALGALLFSAPIALAQMDMQSGGDMQKGGMQSDMQSGGMMKSHKMKSHKMKHGMSSRSMSKSKMGSDMAQ